MPERPPQLAERLLRWLVGGRDADAVAGDLREAYDERGGGTLWYWRQAVSCAAVRRSPHRRMLPGLGQDFHYALRILRRNPGYAFTAMVCLALAMGVNTALFSFLDSLYFRRLPLPESDRLFQVIRQNTPLCSWREYLDFRDHLRSFQAAASVSAGTYVDIDRQTVNLGFEVVSANYARVLRLGTTLGRWFVPEEDSPASEPAVVISHHLWTTRFHADSSVPGKQIRIHDVTYRIVGVAPAGFVGDRPPIAQDLWFTEATLEPGFGGRDPAGPRVSLIARLAPGATFENAAAEVSVIDAALRASDPKDPRASDPAVVEPASGFLWVSGRRYMKPVAMLMSVVCGMVLLIACVNVANLLLSRAAVRGREIAVRQSLGASRFRLFRQAFIEGLVLAAGGVALGVLAGCWIGRLLESVLPTFTATAYAGLRFELDWRVALFVCAAGAASAVLFSLPGALKSGRRDLGLALKESDERQRPRQREWYSLAQVALSLTLLIATSLLLRALAREQSIDPGVATDHRLYVNLWASPEFFRPEESARLFTSLLQQARELPGVRDATLASSIIGSEVTKACASSSPKGKSQNLLSSVVEPNFFEMLRVPIVRGRAFGPSGALGEPPGVIVNETMARTWWPGEDPLGKPLWMGCQPASKKLGTVIGVARDGKYQDLDEAARPFLYLSRRQDSGTGFFELIVQTEGDPDQWSKALLAVAQSGGPKLHIFETRSLDDALAFQLRELRWRAGLAAGLGLLAVVLAAIGLYGVVAYTVSQRTREIGMRMALGATAGDVQWLVLGRGLRITAAGIGAGLLLSAVAMRWLRSYLYGLSPFDPVAFAAASLAWMAIAMLASWQPARRATRVDPLTALKYE